MSRPIRSRGGHLNFPIRLKNTTLVEDIAILLPFKFHWIPFSGFREEVKNVSANQRPGRPFLFFRSAKKKNPTNLGEDVEILLPVKFRWIPFGSFRGDVENVSANRRPGKPSCFFRSVRKTQTWQRTLRSCSLSSFVEFCSEEKSKMFHPTRGQGGHLVFPIGPKNTNLVEDVELLLPVKFRWIPVSAFKGEVENVSANQRPERPSCFPDRSEKHKLGKEHWDLASGQVSLNSV